MKKIVTKTNISLLIIVLCAILFCGLFTISNLALKKVPVAHAESSAILKGSSVEGYTVKNVWWSLIDYQIENLVVTNTFDTSKATTDEPIDVSAEQNGSLYAYKIDNGNDTYNCVIYADVDKIYAPENSTRLFAGVADSNTILYYVKSISFENNCFDTSLTKNMAGMFCGCSSVKNINVSGFVTSQVTDMTGMFSFCSELEEIDVSNFDTSNVESFMEMFSGCYNIRQINIKSKLLTSNPDVYSWNTTNATDMNCMFASCKNLTELDLSFFNTDNVVNMYGMFTGCRSLNKLNISSFDLSSIEEGTGTETKGTAVFFGFSDDAVIKIFSITLSDGVSYDQYLEQLKDTDVLTYQRLISFRAPLLTELHTPKNMANSTFYIPMEHEQLYIDGNAENPLSNTGIEPNTQATMYTVTSAEQSKVLKTLSSSTPSTGFIDEQLIPAILIGVLTIVSVIFAYNINKKRKTN